MRSALRSLLLVVFSAASLPAVAADMASFRPPLERANYTPFTIAAQALKGGCPPVVPPVGAKRFAVTIYDNIGECSQPADVREAVMKLHNDRGYVRVELIHRAPVAVGQPSAGYDVVVGSAPENRMLVRIDTVSSPRVELLNDKYVSVLFWLSKGEGAYVVLDPAKGEVVGAEHVSLKPEGAV